jgi:hypothetical protein
LAPALAATGKNLHGSLEADAATPTTTIAPTATKNSDQDKWAFSLLPSSFQQSP